jgi:hypothetical protein
MIPFEYPCSVGKSAEGLHLQVPSEPPPEWQVVNSRRVEFICITRSVKLQLIAYQHSFHRRGLQYGFKLLCNHEL